MLISSRKAQSNGCAFLFTAFVMAYSLMCRALTESTALSVSVDLLGTLPMASVCHWAAILKLCTCLFPEGR